MATEIFARLDVRRRCPACWRCARRSRPTSCCTRSASSRRRSPPSAPGCPPSASGSASSSSEQLVMGAASARLQELRAELGLPARPGRGDARRGALLHARAARAGGPGRARHARRRSASARTTAACPACCPTGGTATTAPLVYLTLGSVAPSARLLPRPLPRGRRRARDLPVRVLVTTGRERRPGRARPAARPRARRALGPAGRRHAARVGDGLPRRLRHGPRRAGRRRPAGRAAAVRRPALQRAPRRGARRRHRARGRRRGRERARATRCGRCSRTTPTRSGRTPSPTRSGRSRPPTPPPRSCASSPRAERGIFRAAGRVATVAPMPRGTDALPAGRP